MKPCGLFVICCLLALGLLGHTPYVCGTVTLVNNGYEGVTVFIAASVTEDPTLIDNIKDAFREASDLLFLATKNRAFFRHISIVIPQSWTSIVTSGTVPAVGNFDGYIRVDNPPPGHGHRPYTRGNLECGKGAWFTHLTPAFLNGDYNHYFGRPAKSIVHEWGHLRWGLFDEYPSIVTKSTAPYKVAFSNGGGRWNPVTCSKQVTGNALQGNCDPNRNCPIDNLTIKRSCKFCPNQAQSAISSIMASQWIETVVHFCEKDDDLTPASRRHDSTAPNLQNKMCNQRSAWEVMEEHEDFRGGNNPATSMSSFEEPTFQIVKESTKVRVFVYDVSGSMGWDFKITKQADASYVVIDSVVETGSYLALVSFTDSASTLVNLTEVADDSVRETLKQRVPTTAGGGTEIYEGLNQAIQVIEASSFATSGAEIVLLSDGESNSPYDHIFPILDEKGIIVHTIAITNAADANMTKLAAITGGKSYTYLETSSVTFADVFKQATTSNSPSVTASVEILSSSYNVSSGSPVSGVFYIDEGLGSGTTITIIQTNTQNISLTVQAPNGTLYSNQGTSRVLTLKPDGISQVGEYNFTISTTASSVAVEVMVSSVPTSENVDTIQVTSFVNSSTLDFNNQNQVRLTASVQKGTAAVLNANVTAVLAANASFTPLYLTLTDTGTGADAIYGDGIYSTYLLKKYFTSNSGYNIKVHVGGHGEAYTQTTTTDGADAIPGTVDDTDITTTTVGSFTRESVPGEVTVANYVSNPVDTTPPSQITDLQVDDISKVSINGTASMIYTLSWTSPGSDMDIGQATEYDMRLNPDTEDLRNNFIHSSVVPVELPVPNVSGSTEFINITFNLDHCVGICYLAVRAKDENNLTGDISNIINIDIDFSYVAVTVINFPEVDGSETEQSIVLVLVLSLLATVIVLVILALVVYKFLYRKSKKGIHVQRKIDPSEDTIFIVEQADGCEMLRYQYYNRRSVDAVVPLSNADFNSKPTFSMTRIAKTCDKRDNSWFDIETGKVHRPTEEKVHKCKDIWDNESEGEQESLAESTNDHEHQGTIFRHDGKENAPKQKTSETLSQDGLQRMPSTYDAEETTPEEDAIGPNCFPEASNTQETVGESDILDPLFAVDRSEMNAKHAG